MSEEKKIIETVQTIEHVKTDIPEKVVIDHDSDSDQASDVFIKSEAEKKLVRKINYTVLPLMFLVVVCQFCDKSALSVAAVMGIIQDTNITMTQFNWAGSIFYLGYLICQIFNYYFIQKFRTKYYLGTALVLWGFVVIGTAFCNNFAQLAAVRFLLGLFEGCTYPCVYIVLNSLYRRSEQPLVWGFISSTTGFGSVIGIALAFIYLEMVGLNGWNPWRWGYLINGILTVLIGILVLIFMVDDPYHRLLKLTEEEKAIVDERVKDNCVVRVKEIKVYQMWEALKEWRFYLIFLLHLCYSLQNGGLVTYSTLLVQNLGFGARDSVLLQIPNGMSVVFFAIIAAGIAHRIKKLCLVGMISTFIAGIGFILMINLPGKARLLGIYLSWAMVGNSSLSQSIVTANVSGYTKKVFYNNAIMVSSTIGNFCGPLLMIESQAPRYINTMAAYTALNFVSIFFFAILYYIMKRENKRRQDNPSPPVDVKLDLTDVENKAFIYSL